MPAVTSADGTTIAYERAGSGPPLVLVDGALCHRAAGPMRPLAALLHDHFTVYAYDRRGRGDSSDTAPYAAGREVEDLHAVIDAAGGAAHVSAMSSGGAIALAAAGPRITRMALYEPPYVGWSPDDAARYTTRLTELLAAGRRGDAVALFMSRVGVPGEAVAHLRGGPGWAGLEAIAPTLAYDDALLAGGAVPHRLAAAVTVPTLLVAGGSSPAELQAAAKATAAAVPGAQFRVLPGQTHDVDPAALAPVLTEFFTG